MKINVFMQGKNPQRVCSLKMTTITKSFTLLQCQLMVGVFPCTSVPFLITAHSKFFTVHVSLALSWLASLFVTISIAVIYILLQPLYYILCASSVCLQSYRVQPGSNAQKMPHTKCKRKTIECNERRIAFAQRSDEMLQLKENNSQSETKPNREKKRKSNFVR